MTYRPMTDDEIRYYAEGLKEATILFFDLALGENSAGILTPEEFSCLLYSGPLPDELRKWLKQSRERAYDGALRAQVEASGRAVRDAE